MQKNMKLLLIVCLLSSYSLANADSPKLLKVISPLDSQADIARWSHRPASMHHVIWKFDVDPETQKASLLFVSPTKDKVIYPGMNLILNSGKGIDIRHYGEFVFEANCVGPSPALLQLVMKDDKGVCRYGDFKVTPGWKTYRVAVPRAFKSVKLAQVQFGYDTPQKKYKVKIANLRLENNDPTKCFAPLQAKVNTYKAQLTPELTKKFNALRDELKTFTAKTDAPKLTRWIDSVHQLEQDIQNYLVTAKVRQWEALFENKQWGYAWADGVTKVLRRDNVFPGTFGQAGSLSMARNEYEGTQLVLRSKKKVSNVSVSVSDLVSKSGAKIPAANIEVLPVGYVNTKRPPYPVDYVGWWPDPLLDFLKTFEIEANAWQPVWFDVHTTADQKPGDYAGTITVTGDGVEALKIPLKVKVWDFAVPHEKHFPVAINWFDGSEGPNVFSSQYAKDPAEFKKYKAYLKGELPLSEIGTGEAAKLLALRSKFQKTIIAHRINPLRHYNETPPLTSDVKLLKESGFKTYCIQMIWSQRQLKKGDPYPAEKKAAYMKLLEEAVPRLKKAGLLEGAYVYGFDEAPDHEFAAIKDIFGEIKKRWPELQTMTSAYDYSFGKDTGLADVVDIWIPLTDKYDKYQDRIKEARNRGEILYWYICMAPYQPYANWFVEYSAAEHRLLMGLMPFKFKSQGFMYYSMNYWKTGGGHVAYKERLNKGPLSNYDGRTWGDYNGDGLIFYPGDNGPVVTIRMKNIRDGLEDYEYLRLLKNEIDAVKQGRKKCPAGWLERAEKAIAVPESVVKSLTEYTRTGSDVLAARKEIAELLEQVRESK